MQYHPNASNPQVLIEQIEQAFTHVRRQDGVTLHQAMALDNYASEAEVKAARLMDTDHHWTEIPRSTLINFESALSFMDEQGACYYLPAFMIAALEGHISLSIPYFKLTNLMGSLRESKPDTVVAAYDFDQKQSQAIAAFLRFAVGEQGEQAGSQAELQLVWAWEAYVNDRMSQGKS